MKASVIINNTNICHRLLFDYLKKYFYNPHIIKFDRLKLFSNCIDKNTNTIIVFLITKLTKDNQIIYNNSYYDLHERLLVLSKTNVKSYVFIDFIIYSHRNPYIYEYGNITLLFGCNVFHKNNSLMIHYIIKHLKLNKDPDELFKSVLKDLEKS